MSAFLRRWMLLLPPLRNNIGYVDEVILFLYRFNMSTEVYIGYDSRTGLTYFVDSPEKLPLRIRSISLKSKPLDLAQLKALVYDTERLKESCVVDVDGWSYDTDRAGRLVQQFPLFTVSDRPADKQPH